MRVGGRVNQRDAGYIRKAGAADRISSGEPGYFLGRFPAYAVRTVHGPGEILERLLAKGAELLWYVTLVARIRTREPEVPTTGGPTKETPNGTA